MKYTRGELARRTGLHSETLRYYEQLGLIPAPARSESGYRIYGEETEIRLGFIRDAKAHGFSLKEIAKALSLSGGSLTLEDFEALIARKKERLDRQIDALRAEHDRLSALCLADSRSGAGHRRDGTARRTVAGQGAVLTSACRADIAG
ncbi:MerR family transcriptional regulator [Paenibacillus spiritus]|nr:MerR family transcriptional regulator [Paenibacillus spiritus]